jgi:hypothetical protein
MSTRNQGQGSGSRKRRASQGDLRNAKKPRHAATSSDRQSTENLETSDNELVLNEEVEPPRMHSPTHNLASWPDKPGLDDRISMMKELKGILDEKNNILEYPAIEEAQAAMITQLPQLKELQKAVSSLENSLQKSIEIAESLEKSRKRQQSAQEDARAPPTIVVGVYSQTWYPGC